MSEFKLSEKKLYKPFSNDLDNFDFLAFLKKILSAEKNFFLVAAIYGVMIALLSLAVPLCVQLLINSVAFSALLQPVAILALILFFLLTFSGILNAAQIYVAEIFQRRFISRIAAEISLQLVHGKRDALEESNLSELTNRFFETTAVQKIVPRFLTETFALALQTTIGLILLACYHPILLLFSLLIVASLFLIWRLSYHKAISTSFYESRRKYDIAAWLEDISRSNDLFKSENGKNYAKFKIDFLTGQYLKERKKHFRQLFSQTISLLALYAVASSILLMIGGWLVIKGQLTMGQLVAAEMILSAILYGISKFGKDFDNFYDLVSACEKLSQFFNIPCEKDRKSKLEDGPIAISLKNISHQFLQRHYYFNLNFASGKNYLIASEGSTIQKLLINFLSALSFPDLGCVEFNGQDISQLDGFHLRSKIVVLNNSPLLEGEIEEYLTFGNQSISKAKINEVLEITGLNAAMTRLGLNLNSRIIPSGWPFSESEKILLKVARALILEPRIIIITEALDMINWQLRQKILRHLTNHQEVTVLYFSSLRNIEVFDECIFIDHEKSFSFKTAAQLEKFEEEVYQK
jgi:putative ABC transport system ATP-binding protein